MRVRVAVRVRQAEYLVLELMRAWEEAVNLLLH